MTSRLFICCLLLTTAILYAQPGNHSFQGENSITYTSSGIENLSVGTFRLMNAGEPVINSYSSANGCFQAGVSVTIYGINFTGTTEVLLGDVPATSYSIVSDTVITAIPAAPASSRIRVTTPLGIANFILPNPVLTAVIPSVAKQGDTVLIRGRYLCATSSVSFGGTNATSYQVLSDSLIEAVVPQQGTDYVRIMVPGRSSTSISGFLHTGPYISSAAPTNGGTGTIITINGIRFTNTTAVRIGNTPVSSFTVVSDIKITAVVPPLADYFGLITVVAPNGTATGQSFLPTDPRINEILPSSGKQGDTIRLKGTNLDLINTVTFGGTPISSFVSKTFSETKVVLGTGSTGPVFLSGITGYGTYGYFTFIKLYQLCPFANTSLPAGKTGTIYQWQVDKGTGFEPLGDTGIYSGTNTNALALTAVPSNYHSYIYRCVVDGQFSDNHILKFKNAWLGSASSNWEDIANWECGSLPDANSDVVIPTGNVFINSNSTCRSLTLGAGANIIIAPGFTLTITH